ncbi:MAG: PQQ-binding-like beta-propeller repeat protein, partial [Pirellulales bacterium]
MQIQLGNGPTPENEDPYGVYLPTDRTLSRGVARAKERLDGGEFNEALAFLQQLLDRQEDVFVDDSSDPNRLQGLKAAARKLIVALPAAGREMYELLHTANARRELDAALAAGDREALAQLVRRYLLTGPGCEAAFVLAQIELDRGHPLSAAHLYEQLLADPVSAARFEPQLSLLAAVSWRAAGKNDTAAEVLRTVAQKYADAKVDLAGRSVELPKYSDSNEELLAWLDESVGAAQRVNATISDWLTARGDPERNAIHRGGAPHWSARWLSRVVNDPRFEKFLAERRELAEQQGVVAIPAARPIATGNVVLMRTPQNVVAIDWQTGKRIWESREEETAAREQYLSDFTSGSNADELSLMSHPLEQRVWDDTLTMSLSSDGERAYALSGMSLLEREDQSAWGIGPGFGSPYGSTAAPTNRLSAYELATEGKLAWEIDGVNATGDLAGVFFLGAPLAVDGSLYVLAEIRSAIYLLALDPKTGALEWRQQLAGLEMGIALDPQRRLNAATPSYSAGILVCPTTAGIVVAVDTIRREFAWVYRYPRQMDAFTAIRPGWQNRQDILVQRANNRWLDGTVLVADGKVLVTPPESNEVHCLELGSGKMIWKKQREKSLFLACIDRGNALLVGPDSVVALRMSDGSAAWPKDISLPGGALPSGLGYLSEGHYYLPLTTGQVMSIDTADGTATDAVKASSESVGGNLICHRGSILSQSALYLEKFEQIEVLRERAKAALAQNPRDATAIRDLAEMRRLEGALDEAVPMLKQAYEIDADDVLTREMLADTLLEALGCDYGKYRGDMPLLRKIVNGPLQQIELLRLEAQGLEAAGEPVAAFDAYLKLVDATSAELTPLAISPQHSARSDRWVRARLTDLWSSANEPDRDQLAKRLAARRANWSKQPSADELRSYQAYFGGMSQDDPIPFQLAHNPGEDLEPLETELELLRIGRSTEADRHAAADILMTQWLFDQGRLAEAAASVANVEANWLKSDPVDGKRPEEWVSAWKQELQTTNVVPGPWPQGRASVEDLPASAANRRDVTRRAQAEFQLGLRRLRVEQSAPPALGPTEWFISQDGARLIGRDASGQDVYRFNAARRSRLRRFGGNADLVQAAQLGDVLYVTLGGQVVALDSRQRGQNDDSDILWQSNQAGRLPIAFVRGGRSNARPIYHASSQRRRVPGAAGGFFASLGPATPFGVVFQDQQRLQAVDPLSGETLWSRSDVPPGCELFGDDEFVLAADTEESKLYVVRMSDGELVEERPLPETPWLLTSGRNIAQFLDPTDGQSSQKTLRIVDGVTGKKLLESRYDPAARLTTLEPNLVAIIEPKGKFELIDIRSTKRLIDRQLEVATPPRSISVFQAGDQLFLGLVGAARQQASRQIGLDYPLVDGQVFAFDLRDGEPLWPGPAVIDSRGLALSQPSDIPVLVFVDRMLKRDASGAGTKLRLLCVDRATGATVYRNDDL